MEGNYLINILKTLFNKLFIVAYTDRVIFKDLNFTQIIS